MDFVFTYHLSERNQLILVNGILVINFKSLIKSIQLYKYLFISSEPLEIVKNIK